MVKKLLSLAAVAALYVGVANAQQPQNADFETWATSGKADGYAGYGDIGVSIGAPNYAFLTTYFKETTVKNSGAAAMRLETKTFAAIGNRTLTGLAQLGTWDNTAKVIHPVPYTGRPTTFTGYYHYDPTTATGFGVDSAIIDVVFTKWDASQGKSQSIGGAEILWDAATSAMTAFSTPIQWGSFADPDSMFIVFISSAGDSASTANHVGSKLYVDNFAFSNFTTGVKETVTAGVATKVAPNPASNVLRLSTSDKNVGGIVRIYDVTGKSVKTAPITGFMNSISIEELNNGVYLYQVFNASNDQVATGKFNVVK
ncbi:MAG: PCMD domain-containing protein [Bacteroidia bacterium]|nr:PCMD domain-containing protein [Bacteroidia bacterium]